FSHRHLLIVQVLLGAIPSLESIVQPLLLVVGGVRHVHFLVDPPRANQSGVEFLPVIRRENEYSTRWRQQPVDDIQETREGDAFFLFFFLFFFLPFFLLARGLLCAPSRRRDAVDV